MLSLRLITTGLNDVHSVIGYEIGYLQGIPPRYPGSTSVLIQPKDGTKYSYEAMHDINGLTIPELVEYGKSRDETLFDLMESIDDQLVLVWYKPFISKFLAQVKEEIDYILDDTVIEDLYALAKQKQLASPSYRLADVYEFTGTTNMFELYDYLNALPEPKRIRRL